jgi:hypothetical protein
MDIIYKGNINRLYRMFQVGWFKSVSCVQGVETMKKVPITVDLQMSL